MKRLALRLLLLAALLAAACTLAGIAGGWAWDDRASASTLPQGMTVPVGGGLPPCGPASAWRVADGYTNWWLTRPSGYTYLGWSFHHGACVYDVGVWFWVTW
jgi:hypothetical protein